MSLFRKIEHFSMCDIHLLTAMYAAHPALLVFALLSTSLPEIPKSQSFTPPVSSSNILLGFTSLCITPCFSFRYDNAFTV